MSNGEAPFRTKMTLGLFTIEPCPQEEPISTINHVEFKSAEVLAIEEAARAQIAAKKARKNRSKSGSRERDGKSAKKPTRSQSTDGLPSTKEKRAGKKPQLPPRSKTSDDLEAAKRKALEEKEREEARRKAEEEARLKAEAEEEARRKAEEEASLKVEEEARRRAEEEEARRRAEEEARWKAEEEALLAQQAALLTEEEHEALEAAAAAMLADDESLSPAEPTHERPKRRISMFPAAKGDTGLQDALQRYGNNVPFEWEKPEWRKEHVDLRHTSTINKMYGWEKPEWATKNILRKTEVGEKVKKGEKLEKGITHININKRVSLTRRHSMTGRTVKIPSKGSIQWHVPIWAKKKILRNTEYGKAVRQGMNLELPVNFLRSLAAGQSEEEAMHNSGFSGGGMDNSFQNSFASLGASKSNIAWEKPSWAVENKLKTSETGMAVRQGASLHLPVTELKVLSDPLDESMQGGLDSMRHHIASASMRKITWEKPVWTNKNLKRTSKGEKMKQTGHLAAPIKYGVKN